MFDSTTKFDTRNDEISHLAARFSSNKIVVYRSYRNNKISLHQEEQARVNFEKKEYNGYLSRATKSYITKILDNWFLTVRHFNIHMATPSKQRQKQMVFFTLTLPSKQFHTDNEIKRQVLNIFIIKCQRKGLFDQWFWRAEKQKNGNIHFHFLIDSYFDKKLLQTVWNECLEPLGYINEFEKKYNHRNPPTTQIQVVPSGQNIIDYVIKYVGKNEGTDKVLGRIWGMSDKLRNLKSYVEDIANTDEEMINEYIEPDNKNVYQDENCMVVMVQFEKRFDYYKRLEKSGLKRFMSANCNYLYFGNVLPVDVLFPKEIKRISITNNIKESQKIQQFELF